MFARLKYGIGQDITVPMTTDRVAQLSGLSVQEAIQEMLSDLEEDPDGTAPVLREVAANPESVIEVKSPEGYDPLEPQGSFREVLKGRQDLEMLMSRPHAGG